MRMYDIIEKKKRGMELTKDEIRFVIEGYTDEKIPDYQMAAFLMAVCFQNMTTEEVYELTMAMMESGDILDLSAIEGIKVDKHSTGGVGDKTTLIVGPIVAALGIPVAKMSGRGLGHTGGTIDKLESIAGFNTSVELDKFMKQVNRTKIAIAGQTAKLAPADKKIYALRDVTATVDNIALISSSIMSKKLASGADAIVLDVKCGSGAFMKEESLACELAQTMVNIGRRAGRKMTAVITDMNEPLGRYVGNSLEVYEAVIALMGNGEEKLMKVCNTLAAYMLMAADVANDYNHALSMINEVIENGKALEKLIQLIEEQGGDSKFIRNPELLPKGSHVTEFIAEEDCIVKELNAELVGKACMTLGGGRETKESEIDLSVGIYLNKKTGEFIKKGEALATVYASDEGKAVQAIQLLRKAYITDSKVTAGASEMAHNTGINKSDKMIIKIIC